MGTPDKVRHFRAPDDLWDAAQAVAFERGEDVSKVLRRALQEYVDLPRWI